MADEVVICEAVEERGIEINEADVQAKIGESYSCLLYTSHGHHRQYPDDL